MERFRVKSCICLKKLTAFEDPCANNDCTKPNATEAQPTKNNGSSQSASAAPQLSEVRVHVRAVAEINCRNHPLSDEMKVCSWEKVQRQLPCQLSGRTRTETCSREQLCMALQVLQLSHACGIYVASTLDNVKRSGGVRRFRKSKTDHRAACIQSCP